MSYTYIKPTPTAPVISQFLPTPTPQTECVDYTPSGCVLWCALWLAIVVYGLRRLRYR